MRTIVGLAIIGIVTYVAFKLALGVAGGLVGLLMSLAWLALKIVLVAALIYWLISVFSPETAKKMRDSFRGESL
jgi:uncharacterized membrane protein